MAKTTFVSAAVAAAFFAALGPGCSSTPAQATDPHKVKRDTEIKHEPCETNSSSAQKVDVKGTGHAAIVHVMKGGKEACRMVDLNMDGRPDVFIYYDEAGNERRREADYDRDGRPDEIVILKGGVVVEKDRSMTSNGRLDTWDTYDNGRLVKRERDTNGDGVIDQWWDFYDPSKPECAIVSNDANGDGEPDPQTAVDLCKEGKPIVASAAPPASGSAAASAPPAPPPPPPPPPPPAASPASSAAAPPAKTPAPPSATPAPPSTTPAKAAP